MAGIEDTGNISPRLHQITAIFNDNKSSDRVARLWLWRPEDLIQETSSRVHRDLTRDEWNQYLGSEEYQGSRASSKEATP